jgi:hypothetical protein
LQAAEGEASVHRSISVGPRALPGRGGS